MNINGVENEDKQEPKYISISSGNKYMGRGYQFLSTNNESIILSLTCNYLSLGQFELARSSILQLSLLNLRRVSDILRSIIYYGPPTSWQLSVTVPTSTHFVLACIMEYESFFGKDIIIENNIIRRIEFDLLMVQMITDNFNLNANFDSMKNFRCFYCSLINIFDINVPELKILPKIVGLPAYLSRFPSFSTNINKVLQNYHFDKVNREKYFSTKIINEMFGCFVSRNYFIQFVKLWTVDFKKMLIFKSSTLEFSSTLKSSLSMVNTSLNWIILKNCILDLVFFKENGEPSMHSLATMISKGISTLQLECLFEKNDLISDFSYENNSNYYKSEPKEPEYLISVVVAIFCIINLFCRYDLSEEIFSNFLIDQGEILKNCEEICTNCVLDSSILPDINHLFSKNIFKQLNNFEYIYLYFIKFDRVKLFENNTYKDYIGTLIDSYLDQNLMLKLVIMFDSCLFNTVFGINNYFRIFSLPKYSGCKNNAILYPIIGDEVSMEYEFYENPVFWCEYLRYLKLSKNKFEELPIVLMSNLMNQIYTWDSNFFEIVTKIILCFPHLRAVCIFLGINSDPIFNWELLKNLWIPFRLEQSSEHTYIENEALVYFLDEMSRKHAISIFISDELNSNDLFMIKNNSEKNTNSVFKEIALKKSVIQYLFDSFILHKQHKEINWKSLEEFISNVISLPLTAGVDISLLTEERDCIKSYLVQREVFEILDGKGKSNFGVNLQNISLDIGNIQTNCFHNELIYCFLCRTFIYLKKNGSELLYPSKHRFFNITHLIYYLFIWSNRLSSDYGIEILPIINKLFERSVLMIELILFSHPYNIPDNLIFPNNLLIFTWWYRSVISVPSRVFNIGRSLISSKKDSEYIQSMFYIRWVLRKTYGNSPWHLDSLSFESNCIVNYDQNCTRSNFSDILLSNSILTLKLLSIQNYEKSAEIILDNNLSINVKLIALDGFVFNSLFEKVTTLNSTNIKHIYNLIKNISNQQLLVNEHFYAEMSLISILDELFSHIGARYFHRESEIGWLLHIIPKLYLGFIILDFCISLGDSNSNNSSELTEKAKCLIKENSNGLNCTYISIVETTLIRLSIFYQTSITTSLTRYIMEIDTLPQQTSLIKTHLDRIHDKQVLTTALAQSLNQLSGFTQNKSPSEHLINVNQKLEQCLFTNGNNSNYLCSVLYYIKSIISELFSNSDDYTAFPILALTPNEIISYSFFQRKLLIASKQLSKIMKTNLISVIVKTLNCIHSSISMFELTESDTFDEIEFLYKELFSFRETLTMVFYNILPHKNVQYNYYTWSFVVDKVDYNKKKEKITLPALKYRIWKYDIHRQLKSKLHDTNLENLSGFHLSNSLEYFNYLFKWLSIIEVFFFSNHNDLSTVIKLFNDRVGLVDYFSLILPSIRIQTIDKVVLQTIKENLKNNETESVKKLTNFKRIVKLNNPFNAYELIFELQRVSDPHFTLSIIEIIHKVVNKNSVSWVKDSKSNSIKELVEDNVMFILSIQKLFCISFINNFGSDFDLWNKWCILIREWMFTTGVLSLIGYLIEINLYEIAKLISQELLLKVLEFNGDIEYTENAINSIVHGGEFFDEIRNTAHSSNSSLVTYISCTILNMQNCHNFQKHNFKTLNKGLVLKKSYNFENIVELLKSDKDVDEKYRIMDAYIHLNSSLLNINKINALKTILISLKFVKDLGFDYVEVSWLFSPFLILRLALITRRARLIDVLERYIDIFLKSEDILLSLIEESLGVVENKHLITEKIMNSFVFGQADVNVCMQLFPMFGSEFELELNARYIQSNSTDIHFTLQILSIVQKKRHVGGFLLKVSEKISKELFNTLRQYILYYSLIRPKFGCKYSQLWLSEEGSLKIIPDNIHPFSKFLTARSKSLYTNNQQINTYKNRFIYESKIKFDKVQRENTRNVSKLRVLLRNLTILLTWGKDILRKSEFSIAIKNLSYLFEIWQRIPETIFSLNDVVFVTESIVRVLILSDQLNLVRDISRHILEPDDRLLEVGSEPIHSNIFSLVERSITFSRMELCYSKSDCSNFISALDTNRSKNEMIMEIFCNRWGVSREQMVKIECKSVDAFGAIENHILLKPDTINLNILLIVIAYCTWDQIQKRYLWRENHILEFPITFLLKSNVLNQNLFEHLFISSVKIRRAATNTLPDILSSCLNLSIGIESDSDFFTISDNQLSLSYTTFFLERMTNLIKHNIFTRDSRENRIVKFIQVKQYNSIIIYYEQIDSIRKNTFQFDFINFLLQQKIPNHVLAINTCVKLNLWWEAVVYILRWSFEFGSSRSRSLSMDKRRGHLEDEHNFEALFFDLVLKRAHYTNQWNTLISAINDAAQFGGPRGTIALKRCKHTIQRYLELNGALEMLYASFLTLPISGEVPHTLIGAIAIHLSLLSHIHFDSKRRTKSGMSRKGKQNVSVNYKKFENTEENSQIPHSLINFGKLNSLLIPFIADIPIFKMNLSPWGGLSLLSIQRIIKLIDLQNSIVKFLLCDDTQTSILSPNYKDRRDTVVKLFLNSEYSLAFRVSSALEMPLMEVLVQTTKELIVSYPENNHLSCFLDSMKHWLSEDDSDALITNAVNMWISEKKINLHSISELGKIGITELINKLSNPLGKREAFNVINPNK
ncbi:hypothetical protein OJ252_1534 [Cryptosporidium canis]|uniref:Non-specific serine/threonine protein kinase n=1 Tax=Cryptosporidium canis TaxID=195482 RepID=A0ABQ8P877_9CRYT|nr:hypothetical protein OJ252_1534 [Cryptosporidium canis]